MCYISHHNEEIIDFCIKHDLKFENYDRDIVLDEKWEVEQQNIRAKRKAEKYQTRAETLEVKAEQTTISQHESDFLSLWEPIKVWHHSEGRHRRLLERTRRTMDKQHELYEKSSEAERKAKYRENKKFYTEDEKKQKKERAKKIRELAEQLRIKDHSVWWIYSWRHTGDKIIRKINAKTVCLEWWWKWEIAYSKDFDLYLKKARDEVKKND